MDNYRTSQILIRLTTTHLDIYPALNQGELMPTVRALLYNIFSLVTPSPIFSGIGGSRVFERGDTLMYLQVRAAIPELLGAGLLCANDRSWV